MKRLISLLSILVLVATSITVAQIEIQVYEADGETLFDGNDVMVGDKLVIIVNSDSNDYWSGGLFIEGQDRALATLTGRGYDPNTRDYANSPYQAAGNFAKVTGWKDSSMWGFDMYTFYPVDGNSEDNSTIAGEWFVTDYEANDVGDCNITFYDYSISWTESNYFLSITNSPTRDLNSDEIVDFVDYSIFASQWDVNDCNDPNWCDGADLDRNGTVDYNDLDLFVEYWLWGASRNEPNEPNEPNYPENLNIIYRIVDINDSNEITIDVNDTITLYVRMTTTEANDISTFYIEVDISDPNFGSIDNTEYDADNPPGPGTARILADPNRDTFFDYWGPGIEQQEGILLLGVGTDNAFADGNLASFEFTCEDQNDVTLNLINWYSTNTNGDQVYPKLESILIHQNDPNF